MLTTAINSQKFQRKIWSYYKKHRRAMPWRQDHSLYGVLVSELMLQQTQVSRVLPKYQAFMQRFPTMRALAEASLGDVLIAWQGLGYNRRAKYLHQAAQQLVDSGVPTYEMLIALPGIGANTAGAILAYAYNQPVVFIETNIRTVFFHEFFADDTQVHDSQLRELVAATLDTSNPREWYYALMDYGTYLKTARGRLLQKSRHYKKQSTFAGSFRAVRGAVVRALTQNSALSDSELHAQIDDPRLEQVCQQLQSEGLIERRDQKWCLTGTADAS